MLRDDVKDTLLIYSPGQATWNSWRRSILYTVATRVNVGGEGSRLLAWILRTRSQRSHMYQD